MTFKINISLTIILIILIIIGIFLLEPNEISFEFKNKKLSTNLLSEKEIFFTKENIKPKVLEKRVIEVDLSDNKIYFFENNELKKIIPIAYQAPYGKWYQTPTGYFNVGIKKEKHISSLFPVYMNYAVQMYEDFFIHEIPYYLNGKQVDSNFTGGCIRLKKKEAKEFYDLVKTGDLIISYLTFKNVIIKENFYSPVNTKEFFIRQRFNNPLRVKYLRSQNRKTDYIQHAGVDLAPILGAKDRNVYAVTDAKVVKIVKNGNDDHGLGNTIIIEINEEKNNQLQDLSDENFNLTETNSTLTEREQIIQQKQTDLSFKEVTITDEILEENYKLATATNKKIENKIETNTQKKIYILYGHLKEINPEIKEGDFVKGGQILGMVGATGYGCNYWRIGEDGCESKNYLDIHLHLEVKTKPVLESPIEAVCEINNKKNKCYGYVPDNPEKFGYFDPLNFLFDKF